MYTISILYTMSNVVRVPINSILGTVGRKPLNFQWLQGLSVSTDGHGQWVYGVMSTVSGRIVQGIPGLNARAKPRGGVTSRNIPKWESYKIP